ncbi:hypothetical protein [Xanthobacter flavus]|uniref:hypothetical protein n=1 Tax=Xanthobacter flavus TaxID=281 RepID=UPI0037265BA4
MEPAVQRNVCGATIQPIANNSLCSSAFEQYRFHNLQPTERVLRIGSDKYACLGEVAYESAENGECGVYRFISEACIACDKADIAVNKLCRRLTSFCSTIKIRDGCVLQFDGGRATLKLADSMFLMRVQANDLVCSCAIKAVLEGALAETHDLKQKYLVWVAAKNEPFAALAGRAAVTKGREQRHCHCVDTTNDED